MYLCSASNFLSPSAVRKSAQDWLSYLPKYIRHVCRRPKGPISSTDTYKKRRRKKSNLVKLKHFFSFYNYITLWVALSHYKHTFHCLLLICANTNPNFLRRPRIGTPNPYIILLLSIHSLVKLYKIAMVLRSILLFGFSHIYKNLVIKYIIVKNRSSFTVIMTLWLSFRHSLEWNTCCWLIECDSEYNDDV